MWEDFGKNKAKVYNARKFSLINRVGLTNFIREEAMIKLTKNVKPQSVLDIGCASGRQVFLLAPYCNRVVGVDIAQSFIDECNEQKAELGMQNTEFAVATFDTLPNEQFDVVLCGEVLEHVVDLEKEVRALSSAVNTGGYALITVPHYNADGTWWGRLLRLFGVRSFTPLEHFSADEIIKHGDAHVREFSRKRLKTLFEDHGYKTVRCFTVSHLDGPWGDKIISGLLERLPFTRPFLVGLEHVLQKVFPGLGRHIVLLTQKR